MASNHAGSSASFHGTAAATASEGYLDDPRLSPLEASILTEYTRLNHNLDQLAKLLSDLASTPSSNVADGLRVLERKTALVCTALKSSVYGIVLQQQIEGFDNDQHGDGGAKEED